MLVVPEPPVAATRQPEELQVLEEIESPSGLPGQLPVDQMPAGHMPAAQPLPAQLPPAARKTAVKNTKEVKTRWPLLIGIAVALIGLFAGGMYFYFTSLLETDAGEVVVMDPAGERLSNSDLREMQQLPRGESKPPEENQFDTGDLTLTGGDQASSEALEFTKLIQLVRPSIVKIQVTRFDGEEVIGSGFFLDTEGKICTNSHVIRDASKVFLETADGKKTEAIGFLQDNSKRDLAIIQVDPKDLVCVPIAIADKFPDPGEDVAAFGAPRGFGFSQTLGKTSNIRGGVEILEMLDGPEAMNSRFGSFAPDMNWIQHTAAISGGNSGGPLVNMMGELVGVNTWQVPEAQNLNFASTMKEVKKVFSSRDNMMRFFTGMSPKLDEYRGRD